MVDDIVAHSLSLIWTQFDIIKLKFNFNHENVKPDIGDLNLKMSGLG